MAVELVGGALISASIQILHESISSHEVMAYLLRKLKRADFEQLLRRLKTSVSSVTAVLDDAEHKRMRRVRGIEEWLDELQEVVFDAEDLLDEIETDALRRKVEANSRAVSRIIKVRNLFKRKKFRNLFSRSRVERRMEKILLRMEDVASKKELLGLKHVVAEKEMSRGFPSTSLVEESEVYGRDEEKDSVMKLLLLSDGSGEEGGGIGVIPIVGMGGLGKTTLAQLVYNDERATEFELKAWVCVSENMDIYRVTKSIFEAVASVSCDSTDLNLIQVRLREALKGKKFLVVMDDVWNENYDDWEAISRPFKSGAQGSKIIVTTRSEKVARVVASNHVYLLKELVHENCVKLFSRHAMGNSDLSNHPELRDIGLEVIKKCKGLPLAVKTIGGLLRSTRDAEDWERVLKSEIWDFPDEESNILPGLRLSYHYLPSYLKRCFAYCSMFPKTFEFEKEQMVLLWMAENLLPDSNNNMRIEEVGEQCFNELVSRSFFQRSSTRGSFSLSYTLNDHFVLTEGETTSDNIVFVMHDLVHDLAKYVSTEYCLHLEDRTLSGHNRKKIRRLTYIAAENDPYKRFDSVSEARNLRVFLPIQHCESLNCNGISIKLVHDWLLKLRYLRALSLSGYAISELPGSIGELKHLRYLDCSHTWIITLPKSICKLFNLQTLKLNSCRKLEKLPRGMYRLVNLRYFDVRFCDSLVEMPIRISEMKSLRVLSTFIVGTGNESKMGELREHSDLRGELCIKKLENVKDATLDQNPKLTEKKRLETLAFEWSDRSSEVDNSDSTQARNVLEILLPNRTLKKLRINNYLGRGFPNWVNNDSLGNIVFLELSKCRFCESLPPLGQLPSLKTLIISQFDSLVNVGPEFYGVAGSTIRHPFSALETLNFHSIPSWEKWIHVEDSETFAKLQELDISKCDKLTGNFPSFLPSLAELGVSGCDKLVSSLPRMPVIRELKIGEVEDQIQIDSFFEALKQMEKCPKYIRISDCPFSTQPGFFPYTLKTLDVSECKNLEFPLCHQHDSLQALFLHHSCDSLRSLPLDYFPRLNKLSIEGIKSLESLSVSDGRSHDTTSLSFLHITNCPSFVSFPPGGLRCTNLFFLQIEDCVKLKSLPEKMRDLLPSLELLLINNCPELESFPDGGLPLNLSSLIIMKCDKILASRTSWNLDRLTNLTSLTIRGTGGYKDLKRFPEEGILPCTIVDIAICEFPGLVELDENGLRKLGFLKELYVSNCPKLRMIPNEGLPRSLEYFEINSCPYLERKCRRKTGKYWSKIDRVHCVKIGDDIVS